MAEGVNLTAFLERYAERPFVWGQDDCSLFLADWWRENHGTDPAAKLRGGYSNADDCKRVIFWSGGLVRLVSGIAKSAGAQRTNTPTIGDFGVIRTANKIISGIRCDGFWAVRNEQIGFVTQVKVLRAWAI